MAREIVDSLLVDRDVNNWSVRVFTNYKDQNILLENDGNEADYYPNNRSGIGFGYANKKLVLDIAFNIKEKDKIKTERFDFQGSFLAKQRHIFDFFIQNYKGFNVENNVGEDFVFRKDIRSFSIGSNYLYLFNYENFSMSTLKSGSMLNHKTSTTFGLGGFIIYNDIKGDTSILPDSLLPYFNEQAQIEDMNSIAGGILASFSTLFALPSNFFASISINPGIGLEYKDIETKIQDFTPKNPVIYKLGLFVAFGYNAENYYINLNFGRDYYSSDLEYNNNGRFNLTKAKLVFGYNFWKKNKRPSHIKGL